MATAVTARSARAGVADVASKTVEVTGGDAISRELTRIAAKVTYGASVRVGFLENATYPTEPGKPTLHVAQVAFWDEFGTARAPSRPFFRTTIAKQSPGWGLKLGKALKYYNLDAEKAMSALGENIKDEIVESIQKWTTPPNAPSTIRRKGFNKPLVDKAIMVRSVDYKVNK